MTDNKCEECGNGVEQQAEQIRDFAESVDDPDKWRIVAPAHDFDELKRLLDTSSDGHGTTYKGIPFRFGDGYDGVGVKYHSGIGEHLSVTDTGGDQ